MSCFGIIDEFSSKAIAWPKGTDQGFGRLTTFAPMVKGTHVQFQGTWDLGTRTCELGFGNWTRDTKKGMLVDVTDTED